MSVALSALNALTLTPALCALLLRPAGAARRRWLRACWNASFERLTAGYDWTVRHIVRRAALAIVVLVVLSGAAYLLLRAVPTGFAPTEDQGYLLVNVQLPDAASLERTDAVVRRHRADPARDAGHRDRRRHRRPQLHLRASTGRTSRRCSRDSRRGRSAKTPSCRPRRSWRVCARSSPGSRRPSSSSSLPRRSAASAPVADSSSSCRASAGGSLQDVDAVARQIIDAARAAAGARRHVHGFPARRAAARRAGRSREGAGARCAALRRLLEPADLPRLALRERLQRVRPRLPRPAPGGAELPRDAGRHRAPVRPQPARSERSARRRWCR